MHSLLAIAAVAAVTLPAQAAVAKQGFSVVQKSTGKHKFLSGPIAVESTYRKYNVPVPANVERAAKAARKGAVTATPEAYDEAYLCPVSVGTPAQTLMLDFDSGSSDLWVFSTEQPSGQTSGHTTYNPNQSSTSSLLNGYSWNIMYGDGSGAAGNVFADKVVIGGVTATSQAVEAATSVSSEFVSDTPNDGLVGLAFDSINEATPQVQTFFGNVESSLPLPVFAAYLRKGEPGVYDFGFIDKTKYKAPLTYTAVDNSQGFWEFTVTGYAINGKQYATSLGSCIADTGTTLLYLPDNVVDNYYAQVSGAENNDSAGGYIFPCSSTLPPLSLKIGGKQHKVPGTYLNYAPEGNGYCFGGLQSSDGIGFNILGDIFLKSQYVVFDVGNTRIGFAAQK